LQVTTFLKFSEKKNFTFFFIINIFFFLTFLPLDPDPDSESGSGSKDLIESRSNPDPDPKHCIPYLLCIRYHYESTPLLLNAMYICCVHHDDIKRALWRISMTVNFLVFMSSLLWRIRAVIPSPPVKYRYLKQYRYI